MTDHGSHHTGVHWPGDCGLYPAILLDNGVKTDFGSHHTGVHWPGDCGRYTATLLDNGVMTDRGSHHTGVHCPGDCLRNPPTLLDTVTCVVVLFCSSLLFWKVWLPTVVQQDMTRT